MAYEEGIGERLLELVQMDRWACLGDQARSMLEEILAMPEQEKMRPHYR